MFCITIRLARLALAFVKNEKARKEQSKRARLTLNTIKNHLWVQIFIKTFFQSVQCAPVPAFYGVIG